MSKLFFRLDNHTVSKDSLSVRNLWLIQLSRLFIYSVFIHITALIDRMNGLFIQILSFYFYIDSYKMEICGGNRFVQFPIIFAHSNSGGLV